MTRNLESWNILMALFNMLKDSSIGFGAVVFTEGADEHFL